MADLEDVDPEAAVHSRELIQTQEVVSERSPLLTPPSPIKAKQDEDGSITEGDALLANEIREASPSPSPSGTAATISLLLIGVFVANADGSLVLATNSAISSSFSALQSASWLTSSYVMANCAAQPIVGKLSDIFGRKAVLLVCYGLFALGTSLCGSGQTMWQVIVGRSIAGLGGAGMGVIVAIVITDLVPLRDVASWRSYVNVAATTGRMVGAPVGGWLADLVGWRWSFLGQVPLTILAAVLVGSKLKNTTGPPAAAPVNGNKKTPSKIGRIDFLGAGLLSTAIIAFLFLVDVIGEHDPSQNLKLALLVSLSLFLILAFVVAEAKLAREPIFPLNLILRRDVATTYAIILFQSSAQLAIMFSVPLYFQVTEEASNTTAGSRLVPAFIGNTFGSLIAGFSIKKTGRYKKLIFAASTIACAAYITIILRWHGNISDWESLEIFPGGFGSGVAGTAAFIALTSSMSHETVAIATSGYFLFGSLGTVLGVSISSSIQRGALKMILQNRLPFSGGENQQIIEHILADVTYLQTLKGPLKEIVKAGYVKSLEYSHTYSLICSALGGVIVLFIYETPLL